MDLKTIVLVWVEMPCGLVQVEGFILRLVTTHHLCEVFFGGGDDTVRVEEIRIVQQKVHFFQII